MILGALALTVPAAAAGAFIPGSAVADRIRGTAQADRIDVLFGGTDRVTCGRGIDAVTADPADRIGPDCELVSRRISVDTLAAAQGQHQTEVEPSLVAAGNTLVSAFQMGRFFDGAAEAIGFSTSRDAGRTWRSGLLPGLTLAQTPPGPVDRVSDPAVAYDAAHGTWLVVSLGIGQNSLSTLAVNRSADGLGWSPPVTVAQARIGSLAYDKEWIGCDNGSTSPFLGSCYVVYSDFVADRLTVQVSRDGGLTWTAGVSASSDSGGAVVGALPVIQPNGAVTIVFIAEGSDGLYAVRSTDGGTSWGPRVGVAAMDASSPPGLRVPALPAATVDASGRIYVAWADCRFRATCLGSDIVLASSTDGLAWTGPTRIPGVGVDRFIPALAADPSQPGRLGLVYYWQPNRSCSSSTCRMAVSYTRSDDGGATWRASQRLNSRLLPYRWLAVTTGGAFVGDYVGAAFAGGAFVPVFALAQPNTGSVRHEAMYSARLP